MSQADKGRRKHDKQEGGKGGKGTPRNKAGRASGAARGARGWSDQDSDGKLSDDEEEVRARGPRPTIPTTPVRPQPVAAAYGRPVLLAAWIQLRAATVS
jgi:hypothetical protein